jgi:xanthine dehydrogenase YagS FAD-binding subunit
MRPFTYERVDNARAAVARWTVQGAANAGSGVSALQSPVLYLAGGTTLVDLMKLDVMRPQALVDINGLDRTAMGRLQAERGGLRLGAMVRMADAAEHADVRRDYPVVAQTLKLAASQQLRNMASLGGNVLQRTRCPYFRDVSYAACNKRNPGSGCSALDGFNRMHAVLGTSEECIATYPGDFAAALVALDATVDIIGPKGNRTVPFATLHRRPGDTPHIETILAPGEMISAFLVPAGPWTRRSLYLKIRDRQSYEFALASAAVALDMADGAVREARIGLGGVATVPWRARAAEAALRGKAVTDETTQAAADAAFADAKPYQHNAFKIALGKRTLIRALTQAAMMEQ